MTINWEPLRKIFDANQRFVLSSHVRPDADAIGSEIALARLLEGMGKSVRIINPSEIPATLRFLDPDKRIQKIKQDATLDEVLDTDAHVILDTSSWGQLADVGKALKKSSAAKVVIDHHVSADDLGAVEFKDTTAEATGALIFQMVEALGYPLTGDMLVPLFCAIATDTGWFRFSSTTGGTMRSVGQLIDLGAQPAVIYQLLYEQFSLARIHLAGCVLGRVKLEYEGRLGYTWVGQQDFAKTGAQPVDTEDLVNECLKIVGTHCAFIAVEQRNKRIKFSFRSRTGLNVAAIAEQFGGGGHKQASGAMLEGPLTDAVQKVLGAFETALSE